MCGIAGIISKRKELKNTEQLLSKFRKILKHRGPNEEGQWIEDWLGCTHVRLSIVDIAKGQQPMFESENKKIGIVYNGEIYNYKELKHELLQKGYSFKTDCDTEVIIKAYEAWGVDSFNKLNGMFAYCLWDYKTNITYLVRDYIGMKPLYIYEDDEILAFSSEIKALTTLPNVNLDIDPLGVQDYLMFRYTHAPHTIFKKIYRLEAGTYIQFKKMKATKFRYWDIVYNPSLTKINIERIKEEILDTLNKIVKSQLMGEVPIGVLLSGGIDSSIIAYLIHKNNANLTTFNIGYPEANEFEYSREIANKFGLKHIELTTTIDDLISDIDKIICFLDEPIADPACFPLYRLCEELKRHVTVVLSGEGGDELFAGYPQYVSTLNSNINCLESFNVFMKQSYYYLNYSNFMRNHNKLANVFRHKKYFDENCLLNGMLCYDLKTWVPEDLMMKADKIMMAHSLEGRFPFLDKRIIELVHKIPPEYKLNSDGITKWILKQTFSPYLPKRIINRPKMGFTVPVELLLEKLKTKIIYLSSNIKNTPLNEILNTTSVENIINEYYTYKKHPAMQIWTVFILLYWFDQIYKERL